MHHTKRDCVYIGAKCDQDKCFPCPVIEKDDGRQSLLDEICADYRTAITIMDHESAENALKALQKEMRCFETSEWTIDELRNALHSIISGRAWKTRVGQRKLTWANLMASLRENRS